VSKNRSNACGASGWLTRVTGRLHASAPATKRSSASFRCGI